MLTMTMAHVALLDSSSLTPIDDPDDCEGGTADEAPMTAVPLKLATPVRPLLGLKAVLPFAPCIAFEAAEALGSVEGTIAIQKAMRGPPINPNM